MQLKKIKLQLVSFCLCVLCTVSQAHNWPLLTKRSMKFSVLKVLLIYFLYNVALMSRFAHAVCFTSKQTAMLLYGLKSTLLRFPALVKLWPSIRLVWLLVVWILLLSFSDFTQLNWWAFLCSSLLEDAAFFPLLLCNTSTADKFPIRHSLLLPLWLLWVQSLLDTNLSVPIT